MKYFSMNNFSMNNFSMKCLMFMVVFIKYINFMYLLKLSINCYNICKNILVVCVLSVIEVVEDNYYCYCFVKVVEEN